MHMLIDTCAWIDFFKSPTGSLGNQVVELLETNRAVIIAELLQGIKQEDENSTFCIIYLI